MADTNENNKITEILYQHSLELTEKNKTLSLLEELYEKGILNLSPESMAKEIVETIRGKLNFELAGVFLFDKNSDSLLPLAFSRSERFSDLLNSLDSPYHGITITKVSEREFYKKVIYEKTENVTDDIEDAWKDIVKNEHLIQIKKESHIKTILLYPLLKDKEVMGVLLLGINREINTLNDFEKESIKSFNNIIALSLDKAYLYKNLQDANIDLEKLIQQRESLVHLVTHKVKGSFTRSKYIFAEMIDGMFGTLSPELKKIAEFGLDSDDNGIKTVDLILNASNLQKGTVKYDMKPMNFKDIIESTIKEKRELAEKKGLKFEVDIPESDYQINGDIFWLKEVVNNLIDNSIRYTKEGTINIGLKKENGKILFFVKDTGIGVTEEDKKNLFTEGGRGKESVKVNVDSTGYGLYTVKLVVEAHGGKVWVESEGSGKGSKFIVELKAV